MRGREGNFLDGLTALDGFAAGDRRGVFRQSIAHLARLSLQEGAAPFEQAAGRSATVDRLDPAGLAKSVQVALAAGLFDDLGWLAAEDVAVALYEIAGALPLGAERREIGRRVLSTLYEGKAATFLALATRMSSGAARGLSGAGIRARVALSISLPPFLGTVAADPLCFALATRRELAVDWLAGATGALVERRVTGRILERAAREAAARALSGEAGATDLFAGARAGLDADDPLGRAWRCLLADRESLVWRHVASARGLLTDAVPEIAEEIEADLAPDLSPTEWRRAATSLVASMAVDPRRGLARAAEVLAGPLVKRDPGVVIAMMWGVPRAADAEPEACDELLARIAATHALYTAEALVDLRGECGGVGDKAARVTAEAVQKALEAPSDEAVSALARDFLRELHGEEPHALAASLEAAMAAFLDEGTREARALAQTALGDAGALVTSIEMIPIDKAGAAIAGRRGQAATTLRALDRYVLESGELKSLLLLDRAASQVSAGVAALDDLDERFAKWLVKCESTAQPPGEPTAHVTLHQRQLKALLHLIDGETNDKEQEGQADGELRPRVHARWSRTCRLLLERLKEEGSSPFRRSVTATVARGLDALVRDGAADAIDVLLHVACLVGASDLEVLAEATMHPETTGLLDAFARFDAAIVDEGDEHALPALEAFVHEIPLGVTQRTDGLRATMGRLARSLAAISALDGLAPLTELDGSPLVALEDALARLTQLVQTAHRRMGDDAPLPEPSSGAYPLAVAVGRALAGGGDPAVELEPYITRAMAAAGRQLPRAVARVVATVLPRIALLPAVAPVVVSTISLPPAQVRSIPPPASRDMRLPAWMPARRTLGGFYVVRSLGAGGSGTVFVVVRAEERHDPAAERFALKVPEYDANAARSLSEADFMRIFRQEASALLAIPEHEDLARFVTFDAGARPKPILVMELVEGTGLDAVLAARGLTVAGACAILDGILAGLEAMHAVSVGHLDVKPSNVILRGGDAAKPVLVDFGLAGRHIRPGCGTANYVAPEVWVENAAEQSPAAADVYAFGCVAFELLTGETLFDGPNEVALISAHITHDGLPARVKRLASDARLANLAMLLHGCLRHQAKNRLDVATIRAELARVAPTIAGLDWPI